MKLILETKHINKLYKNGKNINKAINDISINIYEGDFIAIAGPSGSGKTTLLNIFGGIDVPSSGKVFINNIEINKLNESKIADFRKFNIGFIFQSNNLIPVLNVKENIEFIMLLQGVDKKIRNIKVEEILDKINLAHCINRWPKELSGGEQQRVALARALVSNPKIILADEPTSNLDSSNAVALINLMKDFNYKYNTTFVFSTHDQKIIDVSKRVIYLKDGSIVKE